MIDIEDMVMGVGALAVLYLPLLVAYDYVNKNYYRFFDNKGLEDRINRYRVEEDGKQ